MVRMFVQMDSILILHRHHGCHQLVHRRDVSHARHSHPLSNSRPSNDVVLILLESSVIAWTGAFRVEERCCMIQYE